MTVLRRAIPHDVTLYGLGGLWSPMAAAKNLAKGGKHHQYRLRRHEPPRIHTATRHKGAGRLRNRSDVGELGRGEKRVNSINPGHRRNGGFAVRGFNRIGI